MAQSSKQQAPVDAEQMGCLGLVIRLTWLAAGNIALVILALLIGQRGVFSGLDVAFWLVAVGLIAARHFDITRLNGQTKDGEPATLKHWRRYVVRLLLVSTVIWGAAHALSIYPR